MMIIESSHFYLGKISAIELFSELCYIYKMPLLTSEIIWAVAVALTIYIIYTKSKWKNVVHQYPPGPPGLPVLGNILQLGSTPQKKMMEWARKYGKIYSINIGMEYCVVVNDHKLIKELLSDISSTGRPDNPIQLSVSEGRHGIVNTDGEVWEAQRRFVLRKLRDVGFAKTSVEGMILDEISVFLDWLESKNESPVSCFRLFNTAVVNALWYIVTGEKNEWSGSESKSELLRVADDFIPSFQATFKTGLLLMPFLRHIIPELSGWNRLQNAIQGINRLCEKVVQRHKAQFDPSCPKDFVDEYLIEISKTTDHKSSFYGKLGEMNLKITLADLSTTLSWIMLYLSQYTAVQKKLQAEIDTVVGSSRLPALSDKKQIPYLEAVVQEVLRLSPLLPNLVPHAMIADKVFHGFLLPKGAKIFSNVYACAHDPEIWGDPENFRPERFISEDGTTISRHEAVLPFSVGRRACIGETLARDTLFLFIACILQRFDIVPDPAQPHPDFEPEVGPMLVPKPFTIIAKKRNVSN
ncbi:Cytochrome P450 2J6 [Orchesella cincta]|uniref:Cytochrome P450 2J6 n=1 Tax=Orchesella cincta TaxID=48709 RepID=A0A1D2M6M6_ORCCI|nr:Cytochrome P450 2J6 [Orchesella cincta]